MGGEYDADFREHPELYCYQSGEQGVFKIQPYKDDLLPHWQFKDKQAAEQSVMALEAQYRKYREAGDFVGMDMVRKYLQMGFTRAMRYAKYPGGKKYDEDGDERSPRQWADPEKRAAAVVFRNAWQDVTSDPEYRQRKQHHQENVADRQASPMTD